MISDNQYSLELISGSLPGQIFTLTNGINTMGRHSSNTVCLRNEGTVVSRHHGILTIEDSTITVSDNRSANGLFVNECRIETTTIIQEDDIIGFGAGGPRLKLVLLTENNREPVQNSDTRFFREDQNASRQANTSEAASTDIAFHLDMPSDCADNTQSALPIGVHIIAKNPRTTETSANLKGNEVGDDWEKMPGLFIRQDGHQEQRIAFEQKAISTKTIERYIKSNGTDNVSVNHRLTTREISLLRTFEKVIKKRRQTATIVICSLLTFIIITAVYSTHRNKKLVQRILSLSAKAEYTAIELEKSKAQISMKATSHEYLTHQITDYKYLIDSLRQQLPFRLRQQTFTDSIEKYLYDIMASFGEHYYRIPPDMVFRVKEYIKVFTPKYRQNDAALLKRWRDYFFPYIRNEFAKEHVPIELAYVAIQESLLDTLALSPKGALGLWQFMPGTGRDYGLTINSNIDERTEWRKSTRAAAQHLHDLIASLGGGNGVLLAMAAYNTGKGRVEKAFRSIRDPLSDRNFWHFYEEGSLPEETREYVLQILARIIIDRHGLDNNF